MIVSFQLNLNTNINIEGNLCLAWFVKGALYWYNACGKIQFMVGEWIIREYCHFRYL